MPTVVKDRRSEPLDDKFGTDRQRFRDRYLKNIQKAIHDKIEKGTLADIGKGGVQVPIPKETTREPMIHHGSGGNHTRVFPGNISFDVGDKIKKPSGSPSSKPGGNGAGEDDNDAEDDFIWVNEAEFLDILFEGRSLPDMSKMKADSVTIKDREPSGYTNKGPDHKMDLDRTDRKRKEESIVLAKGAEKRIVGNLTEQFNILARHDESVKFIETQGRPKEERLKLIQEILAPLTGDHIFINDNNLIDFMGDAVEILKIKHRPKLDDPEGHRLGVLELRLNEQFKTQSKLENFQDRHLTYNYDDDVPKPNAKAVMFCQMDVSGSMTQERKNTAKVFFWLLNKFLKETYDEVDIVFIAHTTTAKEVDEQNFFYGQETGGTTVSSCLAKTLEIIAERYDVSQWNMYSAQASDGDNSYSDSPVVIKHMESLLPKIQGHYYIEIGQEEGEKSALLQSYEELSPKHNHKIHTAGSLNTPADALKAFKGFFPVGGSDMSKTHSSYAPSW